MLGGFRIIYFEFMESTSHISVVEKLALIFIFTYCFGISFGQQTSLNPVSYWVFTPYIYNPAIAGSKDYLSVGINTAFSGKSNAQILSGNTRVSKIRSGYFSSPDIREFNNIGIGWSIFKDFDNLSNNFGASVSGSYQIPVDSRNLSFLSMGVSVKGVYFRTSTDTVEPRVLKNVIYPNVDVGIYYYGANFFSGISATNVLGNPEEPDSLGRFAIPVARQYFFTAGYKILISRALNIVLEPSLLINVFDSSISNISRSIKPILKLYMDNFCLGSSFLGDSKTSFFFQYRYPGFYIGAFYELPEKTPYFKRPPLVEFTFGINIQNIKSRFSKRSQW